MDYFFNVSDVYAINTYCKVKNICVSINDNMDTANALHDSVNKLRDRIYEDILTVMIQGLQDNKVDVEQSKLMAKYVVAHLDTSKSSEDIIHFLDELPQKWEIYKNICVKFKYEEKSIEDEQKMKEIQNKLHTFIQ